MSTRSRIRLIIAVAITPALVLVAACADDGDDVGSESTTTTVSSDAAASDSAASDSAASDDAGSDDAAAGSADPTSDATDAGDVLAPPGVVSEGDTGSGTLYQSEASFDEVVAHYEAVVGDANFVNQEEVSAVWIGEVDGGRLSVNVSQDESGLLNVLVTTLG
jgi:hypothetical protein